MTADLFSLNHTNACCQSDSPMSVVNQIIRLFIALPAYFFVPACSQFFSLCRYESVKDFFNENDAYAEFHMVGDKIKEAETFEKKKEKETLLDAKLPHVSGITV